MSSKALLKAMLPLSLLLVVFLAVPIVSGKPALAPVGENAVTVKDQDASFKIDSRSASPELNNLAGSDYIEHHPSNYFAGSDYIERHPSNFKTVSDRIASRPSVVNKDLFTSPDWFAQRLMNYAANRDWIDRNR